MLFLHQLPFSWWRHPVGIHLLVVGVCAHAPARTNPPYIKGSRVPPEPRDSEDPSVLPLLTRTICCCVFFLPRVSSFLVFFLSSCLFSPAPLPVWVMAIVHNFVSGYGGALHVCDVGARGSVLQRPWGGLPQSDWWGRCRLCSLIHHILYLGFREEEKEKGGQEGGPRSSKNIRPVSPPCFLYPPEPAQE